jgi:predicted signal transduction protein with EAL and GGDEF domain
MKHNATYLRIDLDGYTIWIGGSIGIAIYPTHGDNLQDLIKKADNVMYETKVMGKQNYTFCHPHALHDDTDNQYPRKEVRRDEIA